MSLYSETVVSLHFRSLKIYTCAYRGILSIRASLHKKLESGLISLIKNDPEISGIPDVAQSQNIISTVGSYIVTNTQYPVQSPSHLWHQEVPINFTGSFKHFLPGYPGLYDPELTLRLELLFKPDHLVVSSNTEPKYLQEIRQRGLRLLQTKCAGTPPQQSSNR